MLSTANGGSDWSGPGVSPGGIFNPQVAGLGLKPSPTKQVIQPLDHRRKTRIGDTKFFFNKWRRKKRRMDHLWRYIPF